MSCDVNASDLRECKSDVRNTYLKVRSALSEEQRHSASCAIFARLTASVSYRHARTLYAYAAIGAEVSTQQIIEHALAVGKTVMLPVSDRQTYAMRFYPIDGISQLVPGAYGIPEPLSRAEIPVPDALTMCIVPAVAFDRSGYRIGYGKGYYDRFLKDFGGVKIGLCYDECLTDKLPRGKYDTAADAVVTQTKLVLTN